ncbi:MAG: hypothetical protein KDA45_07980, partial [Planctomycetales bacterium]|nr:hypothetical protein [Planctomycetales bacterium]
GLWRNPFGELTPEERAKLAVVDVGPLVDFLSQARHAVQFLGGCGFGKTTHLLALQRQLPTASLVYFPEDGPRPALPRRFPLLIDEAQRMGWRRRRQMLKSSGPLAIATHQDLSPVLHRAGFRVWQVNVEQVKTPRCLAQILNARIQASSTALGSTEQRCWPTPQIDEAFAGKLSRRYASNLRAIEDYLYQDLQRCIQERRLWPPATLPWS